MTKEQVSLQNNGLKPNQAISTMVRCQGYDGNWNSKDFETELGKKNWADLLRMSLNGITDNSTLFIM